MECDVIGEPKPAVTWYQNTRPVDISKERINIIGISNLEFGTVYGPDSGVYQCVADNGVELEQSSAEFYAGCKLTSIIVSRNSVILTLCEAEGRLLSDV